MAFVVPLFASVGTALGASTATAALTGAVAVGTGVSMVGSLIKGQSKAASYDYNAAVAQQNSEIARQQGIAAVQAQQRDVARSMGTAVANYGASGVQVDSGSPLDVLAEAARNAELDKLTIQYNYELKAQGYTQEAQLQKMGSKTAKTSSYLDAFSTAVEGAAKYTSTTGNAIPIFGGP